MNFIKMIEEMIINKEYQFVGNSKIIYALLVDSKTNNEYEMIINGTNFPQWTIAISIDDIIEDRLESFFVRGPLNYYNMVFHYKITKDDKVKEEYILPIDRDENFQLDIKISRKRIFTEKFKNVLLDFVDDLKNERKYLEYLLDKLASCSFDELNTFVEMDEDGKRLLYELY